MWFHYKPKYVGKGRERALMKIIVSFPTRSVIENYIKIVKNLKKIPLWLHFKPKQAGKCCEREKIKIILPFHSYPRCDRKFLKNGKNIQKINNTFVA